MNNKNDKETNLDCPDSVKIFKIKCESCELIPNFTLYNNDKLSLNVICKDEHSNNYNLEEYIMKIINANERGNVCSKCQKNSMSYCQFCIEEYCNKCNFNHFTIEHVFKNEILNEFLKDLNTQNEEIKEIIQKIKHPLNTLRKIEDNFKEIISNFQDYMINNLNGLLLIKLLLKYYLILKKEDEKNSKILINNIVYLSSFKDLTINQNDEFSLFLKKKENYVIKGSDFKEDLNKGEIEINYFIGKYEGQWKNGVKEGKGKFIYNNGNIYDGQWKNDVKEGNGIMIYKNKTTYDGEWNNNQIEKYSGNWKNNKKDGEGEITFINGDKLKTNWKR